MVCLLRPAGCLIKRRRPSYVLFFTGKNLPDVRRKRRGSKNLKKCVEMDIKSGLDNIDSTYRDRNI